MPQGMEMRDARALDGTVAIVTGASSGLGRAYARSLAAEGAAVALVARSAEPLALVERQIRLAGGIAMAVPIDVTDAKAITMAVDDITRRLGAVDLLVNAAGVGKPIGPFVACDADTWWRTIEVNVRGPMLCARAVLPAMVERRTGRIINVASGAGTRAIPHLSAYITSKTALIRLSELLALETEDTGVHIFAIAPGTVRTAMAEEVLTSEDGRRWIPWFADIFARGLDVSPETSAGFVLRIARGEADALRGRMLSIHDDLSTLATIAPRLMSDESLTLRLVRPNRPTP
jgi:NAD(P)-dependent dehydrogenase (short-subunit alcohol dehydrogenase family)